MENLFISFLENVIIASLRNMERLIADHPVETGLIIFGVDLPILIMIGCHIFKCLRDHWLTNYVFHISNADKPTFREYLRATAVAHEGWVKFFIRFIVSFIPLLAFFCVVGIYKTYSADKVNSLFCIMYVFAWMAVSPIVIAVRRNIANKRRIAFEYSFPNRFQRYERLYENAMGTWPNNVCDDNIPLNVD